MAGEYVPSNTVAGGVGSGMSAVSMGGMLEQPVTRRIRRIGAGSAFRIGAVLYALLFAIIGIFVIVLPSLFASLFGASMLAAFGGAENSGAAAGAGAFGVVLGLFIYLAGIVLYGLMGGIFSAISALLYNLVAGWVGGLRIEVTPDRAE